jgi:hypothetical protein
MAVPEPAKVQICSCPDRFPLTRIALVEWRVGVALALHARDRLLACSLITRGCLGILLAPDGLASCIDDVVDGLHGGVVVKI